MDSKLWIAVAVTGAAIVVGVALIIRGKATTETKATKIVIVGSGVSGLTCALALLKENIDASVEIWSTAGIEPTVPPNWVWEYPPYKVEPEQEALRWSRESLVEFEKLSHDPRSNVAMIQVANMFHDVQEANADHAAVLGQYAPYLVGAAALAKARELVWPDDETCPSQFKDAASYLAPAVAAPEYLEWLTQQIKSLGGVFRTTADKFDSIDDVVRAAGVETAVVINCAGLAALELVQDEVIAGKDDCLYPCKGELAVVEAPWLRTAVFADDEDWYAIPWVKGSKAQLGGTSESHVHNTETTPAAQDGIVQRCIAGIPSLANAEVMGAFAGLRPMRKGGVRVERETMNLSGGGSVTVVHNYGHGGAGMICSWGCAKDVVELVTTK